MQLSEEKKVATSNLLANKCISLVYIPEGINFRNDISTPCGLFNYERIYGPSDDPINANNWLKCRNTIPQSPPSDPNNLFVSSIQSCVEVGILVDSRTVNDCFKSFSKVAPSIQLNEY